MIVVADDDPRLRRIVADIVARRFGHLGDVITTVDGAAALAACAHAAPLLIVSDVSMPFLLGPDWVAQAEARYGRVPAVFMSADPGIVPRSTYSGHPVLQKPFREAALVAAIVGELAGN